MALPVKVLYVARPATGGMARHLVGLLTYLNRRGFTPYLAAPPGFGLLEVATREGIDTLSLPLGDGLRPLKDTRAVFLLSRFIRQEAIDIVHSHGVKASLLAGLAARRSRAVLVSTVHGFPDLRPGWKGRLATLMQQCAVKYADHFIAVSAAAAAVLTTRYRVPEERVSLIYNGIELPAGDLPPGAGRPAVTGYPVVGTVARLVPEKGLEDFLRAAASLHGDFPQAAFVIVGHGPLEAKLKTMARQLGLAAQVTFTGHQPDVAPWLASFDIFVASSISEGFSMATLEAMAAGKPVVASRTGGLAEIIDDGRTGFLVPPGRPELLAAVIRQLVAQPELVSYLGRNARQAAAERYSLACMVQATEGVYATLCRGERSIW